MKKKILALILARKNSKRIPGKNLRKIGKKTLVEWSIDSVKGINDIIDILVSSDDKTIVKIAKKKWGNCTIFETKIFKQRQYKFRRFFNACYKMV